MGGPRFTSLTESDATPRSARQAPHSASPSPDATLHHQLRLVTLAWMFGSFWLWTVSGAAMTQFARALHTPDYGFGILSALPFIGSLVQVPASFALERYGHRKSVFIIANVVARGLWILVAAIPWILPQAAGWWWPAMTLMLLVSWASANAATPAWMDWMSDLIPRRVRGRYFAVRNRLGRGMGILVTLGVGYILDLAATGSTHDPGLMLKVTSAVIAAAGLLGAIDILFFCWVDNPPPPRPRDHVGLVKLLYAPLKDANFRHYLAFNFTLMLGMGFIGQYVWLYVFDILRWTNWQANMLLLAAPLLVQMFTYTLWGRLIDRLGKKPVLLLTATILSIGPIGWLLITPSRFWLGYLVVLITTAAWPGMEIANFNMILDMTGNTRRARGKEAQRKSGRDGNSAYVALNAIAVAAGGILSGMLSSVIAGHLQWLDVPMPWLGAGEVLTYHRLLFVISVMLRLVAILWAVSLVEPAASGTRDAIRYMTTSFFSNVRQAALMPSRVMGRASRRSYRINRR